MAKILTITISDTYHAKLQEIKRKHNLANNTEAMEWLLDKEVAK